MNRPTPSLGLRRSVRHAGRATYVSLYDGRAAGLDTDGGRWQIVCERHGSILSVGTLLLAQSDIRRDPAEFCEGCREGPDQRIPLSGEAGWPIGADTTTMNFPTTKEPDMQSYTIIHFRAGGLKGTVEATSEREALATRFGVEPGTREDGRPVVRYGMGDIVFHEYTARVAA